SKDNDLIENSLWLNGIINFKLGNFSSAFVNLQTIYQRCLTSPYAAGSLYWQAQSSEKLNNWEGSVLLYQQILDVFPFSYYAILAKKNLDSLPDEKEIVFNLLHPEKKIVKSSIGISTDEILSKIDKSEEGVEYPGLTDSINGIAIKGLSKSLLKAQKLFLLGLLPLAQDELKFALDNYPKNIKDIIKISNLFNQMDYYSKSISIIDKFIKDGKINKSTNRNLLELGYPLAYYSIIKQYADLYKVDLFLILAIMREESRFSPLALSFAGARGVMQIMPSTGNHLSKKVKHSNYDPDHLYQVTTNIKMGCYYVSALLKRFNGNKFLAVASFNAGPHAVDKWRKQDPQTPIDMFVEKIPYKETRLYVKKVLRSYNCYKIIYGNIL
ncbi:MAG: transglycosylase SLT domain-containing protein, partial [bacterium]